MQKQNFRGRLTEGRSLDEVKDYISDTSGSSSKKRPIGHVNETCKSRVLELEIQIWAYAHSIGIGED